MVTDYYSPYVGGVEQHVRSLSHALVDRGHSVAVATFAARPSRGRRSDDGPVRVYEVGSLLGRMRQARNAESPTTPKGSLARSWAPPILDPVAAAALGRVIATERPDVVHGHDWLARSVWPFCLGKRPLVLSLHYYTQSCVKKNLVRSGRPCRGPSAIRCAACATDHYGPLGGPVAVAANTFGAWVDHMVVRRMIAVSRAAASGNGYAADGSNISIIPNPLAPPAAATTFGGDAVDVAQLDLPDEPFALFVGDLRHAKGADVLLEAYTKLQNPIPLVMIGGQEPNARLDPPRGVHVIDPVPNATVLQMWQRARFGVVPSRWAEPFGIVAIEAMAAGVPVVGSRIGGLPEIITHGVDGLLVTPNDADALAIAMQTLIDDPALARRLGERAQVRARTFSASDVAEQVESVYADALHRN
jgi:glycosyltransferase involved in cell wall biosynthesis